jgi:ATP-dependent protease ClpP protease subunit
MHLILFCVFIIFLTNAEKVRNIQLHNDNFLVIRGSIDDTTSSNFVYELNKKKNKNNTYVYLDTPGGSVESGNVILNEIQKYNLSCIAEKAYSMGFVLLQGCKKRYITKYAKVMQHQLSYGIKNEIEKINSYSKFINEIDEELNQMQANKINMTYSDFKFKTFNEWWLFGQNIISENVADKMVNVLCTKDITEKNETIDYGSWTYIYSKCPLIKDPVEKIKNKQTENIFFYI